MIQRIWYEVCKYLQYIKIASYDSSKLGIRHLGFTSRIIPMAAYSNIIKNKDQY